MTENAAIQASNDKILISGNLDFNSVMPLWRESLSLLSQKTNLLFDLTQVSSCNSAGVALLLEWVKYANQKQIPISFENIPAKLLSILRVSGIEKLICSH